MHEDVPSFDEFQRALHDGELRMFQIVHLVLGMGVGVFAAVVIGLFLTSDAPAREAAGGVVPVLTGLMLGTAAVCLPLAWLVPGRMLAGKPLSANAASGADAQAALWVGTLRAAGILRLALLDAIVFFGLVNLLLGVLNGFLLANPFYWINLAPAGLLVVYLAATFPTRQRIESVYRERVLSRRRY